MLSQTDAYVVSDTSIKNAQKDISAQFGEHQNLVRDVVL